MPDQDEYEPLAKQWSSEYKRYIDDFASTGKDIADGALRTVTRMLRECGGCPLLPEITEILWQSQPQLAQGNLFSVSPYVVVEHINQLLEGLRRKVADQRIEAVSVRAAQTVAFQLRAGLNNGKDYGRFQSQLASQIVKDLIRHCFLDKARAFSVGRRFSSSDEASRFFDNVMSYIDHGLEGLVKQLITRPGGEKLRYRSPFFRRRSTKSMLFDEAYRMDFDDKDFSNV